MKPDLVHWLVQMSTTSVVVAAALWAYDRGVVRPAQRIGVVDVAEVYRQKETEFSALLTRPNAGDDRQKAFLMARTFAQRLPAALEELPRDCHCLVVLKSAVAGPTPQMVDLTALLRQKLGAP